MAQSHIDSSFHFNSVAGTKETPVKQYKHPCADLLSHVGRVHAENGPDRFHPSSGMIGARACPLKTPIGRWIQIDV